jgi:hypothetical protein
LISGDLAAGRRAPSEEGLAFAERTGNDHASCQCKTWLGVALFLQGDLRQARSLLSALIAEAEAERVPLGRIYGLALLGHTLALMGQPGEARAAGEASIAIAESFGLTVHKFFGYDCLCTAAMASGDGGALREASQSTRSNAWAAYRPARTTATKQRDCSARPRPSGGASATSVSHCTRAASPGLPCPGSAATRPASCARASGPARSAQMT